MVDPIDTVLGLSLDASGVANGRARIIVVADALQTLIPADMVGYAEVGLTDRSSTMVTRSTARNRVTAGLPQSLELHPIARTLRSRRGVTSAIRMSDVVTVSEWRRHTVYQTLFRPLGFAHELVLPLPAGPAARLHAWTWNRAPLRDFTDQEVALATMLRPLLAVIQVQGARPVDGDADDLFDRAGLTARERDVLELLPSGMTAQQMGWVLRISPRTVQKHIEHVYEKLGVRDRTTAALLAVGRDGRGPTAQ